MIQNHFLSPIQQDIPEEYPLPIPKAYIDFIRENGAGYFKNTKIYTSEPTRFGIDYALCNGICGFTSGDFFPSILCEKWQSEQTSLPEYLIVFFQDGPIYYCFDVQKGPRSEPSIRLVDTEMDQWLTLAENFSSFLEQLQETTEEISYDSKDWISIHTFNQHMGQENFPHQEELLEILQDTTPQLFLRWIAYLLEHSKNEDERNIALERFQFVQSYLSLQFSSYPEYQICCQHLQPES